VKCRRSGKKASKGHDRQIGNYRDLGGRKYVCEVKGVESTKQGKERRQWGKALRGRGGPR